MSVLTYYRIARHLPKKSDQGFTLIELLVVIIIVGVLSAIALPSFLNQVGKARGSEAKSALGTINRAQQAYRYENSTMAPSLNTLGVSIGSKHYQYAISAIDANSATAISVNQSSAIKVYSSRINQNGDRVEQVLCESNETVTQGTIASLPIDASTCFANYKSIK